MEMLQLTEGALLGVEMEMSQVSAYQMGNVKTWVVFTC